MYTSKDKSPLSWPVTQPRTKVRERYKFKLRLGQALDALRREIKLLGVRDAIITCNLPVGSYGTFLIDDGRLADPGVAVYFTLKNAPLAMGCDKWEKLCDNVNALAHTIEAIRGIARWGSTQMMEQAFRGFSALPAPDSDWRTVFQLHGPVSFDDVRVRYKDLALHAHPDREGGDNDAMVRLNRALEAAERELRS